jgi:hypothetical protein
MNVPYLTKLSQKYSAVTEIGKDFIKNLFRAGRGFQRIQPIYFHS